jgi:hypothetical protein
LKLCNYDNDVAELWKENVQRAKAKRKRN